MPFSHVDHGFTKVAGRHLLYLWFALTVHLTGELKQAGFTGSAAARPKSSLARELVAGTVF